MGISSVVKKYKNSKMVDAKCYGWENRVKFIVKFMYDIDNNGSLDKNDFECLAVRNTVIEGKGAWDEAKYKANSEIMAKLWNEIADLADFDKVRRLDNCFLMLYETSYPSKNVV